MSDPSGAASKPVPVVFWSWQSNSHAKTNRNFIQDALERAVKKAGKATTTLIAVDRDTQGVGGTPNISETILQKIAAADVFVWDATLSTKAPRPAPNPNVLFELGFAVGLLGWNRVVGVLNRAEGEPSSLPFDLLHRRWPITYTLEKPPSELWRVAFWIDRREGWLAKRKEARDQLVRDLAGAIEAALAEPKEGFSRSDTDRETARRLWGTLNSAWLLDWYETRMNYAQFEKDKFIDPFERYVRLSERPEVQFNDPTVAELHDELLRRIHQYLGRTAVEMISQGRGSYVISVKRTTHLSSQEYDKEYDRQYNLVRDLCHAVWEAWRDYVSEVNRRYPEVTEDKSYPPVDHPPAEEGGD